MNPTNTFLLSLINSEQVQPAIIETITQTSGREDMFIGYPLPSCKGYSDDKWLIKLVTQDGITQTIKYANGKREFDQKWTDRITLFNSGKFKYNENF